MNKYINADKLKLILNREHLNYSQMIEKKFVLNAIDKMPSADVVEVVRCKDCKHYTTDNGGGCNKENGGLMFATETDFCSYGERKENK